MTSTLELVDAYRSGYSSVTCADVPEGSEAGESLLDGDLAER